MADPGAAGDGQPWAEDDQHPGQAQGDTGDAKGADILAQEHRRQYNHHQGRGIADRCHLGQRQLPLQRRAALLARHLVDLLLLDLVRGHLLLVLVLVGLLLDDRLA